MRLAPLKPAALADLPRNARNSILMEPLWAVFGTIVLYYAPLYLKSVGLSSTEIGLLGSVTLAFSFVFQLLAAPITNRVGRKRTTLIGDLVSWTVPMFLWALATTFPAFLVAAVLSATGRIVGVSWSLLVIEDVEQSQRARVFGIFNVIIATCGMLTPVLGVFINRYGVEATLRAFYALGGVGMTVMFVVRNAITQETRSGAAAMTEHRDLHPWQSFMHSLEQLAGLRRHPGLPLVTVFYILTVFLEQMGLFQILFFREALGFTGGALSFVPFATAAVTLVMYGLVLRRLSHRPPTWVLVLARALGLLGAALVLLIPVGNLTLLLLVVSVLAASTFLTQTFRDAVLFNRLPEQNTADLFSAVQSLTLLFSIPAAGLAGLIYSGHPRALFFLIAALNVVLLGLAVTLYRRRGRAVPLAGGEPGQGIS
ncbi:MFS transporter [Deinococcus hopiensis]|uniref:Predicted arabinose efflux permease, MFS family n=1 Tax=Deinococcus hopiensis KR-140 TaxID=695939 RepID=A0A1W1UFS3_9DEIO|nr:MFS transporter [Deinococcus hopiensis]SMB79937.1 Predicted arabinose efflux permease, MFS family [Deinococcus hopiensis KR-140]